MAYALKSGLQLSSTWRRAQLLPQVVLPRTEQDKRHGGHPSTAGLLAQRPSRLPFSQSSLLPRTQSRAHSVMAHATMSTFAGNAFAHPAATILAFTPEHALFGGLLLGLATAGKLLLTGRILGISGALKGYVNGDAAAPWRTAFLVGMLAGSAVLAATLPGAFEVIPDTFPVSRAALAGLLVGLGAAMGNGCTSGHGICGNARLSIRSLVYTITFMIAGAATATLTHSADALGVAAVTPAYAAMTAAELQLAAAYGGVGVLALGAIGALARSRAASGALASTSGGGSSSGSSSGLELAAESALGLVFALGLGVSGMMHPSKVVAFLSVLQPAWDLSLMFVMGSAVLVAAVAFYLVQHTKLLPKPIVTRGTFCIPTSKVIDSKLLTGGLLFGVGWGLAGLCPGPALVSLAQPSAALVAYLVSMVGGMWLEAKAGQAAVSKAVTA